MLTKRTVGKRVFSSAHKGSSLPIFALETVPSEYLWNYFNLLPRLLSNPFSIILAWVIDRTITLTYQLQGVYEVVSDRLAQLQNKIYKDTLTIIDNCQSEEELDFIFPELTRIRTQDLAVLESWQHQTEWLQALSVEERELLASSEMVVAESESKVEETAVVVKPKEQLLYEALKPKSHFYSLRDQLKFIIKPELRQGHELYRLGQ